MTQYQPCLDHGFVRVVDYMGSDQEIVDAARVSFAKQANDPKGVVPLIRYLFRHQHTSPFEMATIKFHVKMPIFVARQWVRHRTSKMNEVSARYTILPDEFYFPPTLNEQSTDNKQGRGQGTIEDDTLLNAMKAQSAHAYSLYSALVDKGVAREIARTVLPLNIYTEFYWKMDLNNLFKFLKLRVDNHAQYEIRVFADAIERVVAELFPVSYDAWVEFSKEAIVVSKTAREAVRDYFCINHMSREDTRLVYVPSRMTEREWKEMVVPFIGG